MSKIIDKQYQILQFQSKIFLMNGLEFQSFFEKLMKKHNELFKKIPSRGGDGGNDGWVKETGTYYQVYSPIDTTVKDSDAAKKLVEDFSTLKENWDQVTSIKEYFFVYNDKYNGAQKPEKELSVLEKNNSGINFQLLLSEDLEDIFLNLDDEAKYELGFHTDKRQVINLIEKVFEEINKQLDRDEVELALQLIRSIEKNTESLPEDNLIFEIKLLNAKVKEKQENFDEANKLYQDLININSSDVRPYLYLAENNLRVRNLVENKGLLEKAEQINKDHWLLKIEKIVRAINTGEDFDVSKIDTKTFPNNISAKANYYRLYSTLLWRNKQDNQAKSFLSESIKIYPHKLSAYIQEVQFLSEAILASGNPDSKTEEVSSLQRKINSLLLNFPNITNRNNSAVKIQQLLCYKINNNSKKLEKIAREIFDLLITCYFDNAIDNMMATLLQSVSIPEKDLSELQKYILSFDKEPSDRLNLSLTHQFCLQKNLYTEGLKFFKKIKNKKYKDLIEFLKTNNFKSAEEILKKEKELSLFLAQSLKEDDKNRVKIINLLSKKFPDLEINKEKFLLLLDIDNKNVESALKRITTIGINNFKGAELKVIIDILYYAKAWELEAISLKELIKIENDLNELVNYKTRLFNALLNLKNYKEAASIGEELLKTEQYFSKISKKNVEVVLSQTILCLMQRSVVDPDAFSKAESLINKIDTKNFPIEFLIGVKAELYLAEEKPDKAVDSIVQAAKNQQVFTQEEYAKLYFLFTRLSNLKGIDLTSNKKVSDNSFIKFKDDENWVYLGKEDGLDAIKLSKTNKIYKQLNQKQLHNEIKISDPYSSNISHKKIELIFPIEKYLFWKSVNAFHKLANENLLEGVTKIETPEDKDGIDLQYLLKFMEEQNKRKAPFFDMYLKKKMPFALLALNEGGITNAIGKIQHEQAGFINFSTGNIKEFESQKTKAKKLLNSKTQLYLDATSALVLSEFGLISDVFNLYKNIKVPQSVVSFLIDVANKFNYNPSQSGYMGYAKGNITLSNIDETRQDRVKTNFQKSIRIIESNPECIEDISLATKQDCFTEKELLPESVDACILAQKNTGCVITDDYLYLHFNNFQTKKHIPEYFSSIALARIMYEVGQIKFEKYLDFFSYLSSYRYRFLHFDVSDMEKAIFGDKKIKILSIENMLKFNLGLTLSEDYGLDFENAFKLMAIFLCKTLEDESITPEITNKLFKEIVDYFPTKLDKKEFADLLSSTCIKVMKSKKSQTLIEYSSKLLNQKLAGIEAIAKNYSPGLWLPK